SLSSGEVCQDQEIEVDCENGERKTVLMGAAPTRDAHRRINGAVATLLDLSERTRLRRRDHELFAALLEMAQALVQLDDGPVGSDSISRGSTVVAHRLVALARTVLGCERVTITAVEAETNTPRPVAAVGLTTDQEREWRARRRGSTLREYLDAEQL